MPKKKDIKLIKASQYLEQLWEKKETYVLAEKELYDLECRGSIKTTTYGNVAGGHATGINKDISEVVIGLELQEKLVSKKKKDYLKFSDEVEKLISSLSKPTYRIILKAIYQANMKLNEVAKRYHYSYRGVQKIQNEGLKEIYNIKFEKRNKEI